MYPNKQIGWSQEAILLQRISRELDQLAGLIAAFSSGGGGGTTAAWGGITGTLSAQTDLQNALNLKAPIASPTFTGTVSGITSTMVGLGNVNNTSDANKPISTATQTALDLKAPIASPTFTGTVTSPLYVKSGATATNILLAGGTDIPQTTFVTPTSATTLTNKAITKRVVPFSAASGPITPNADTTDILKTITTVTAITGDISFLAPSFTTKVANQMLMIEFLDGGGVPKNLTWAPGSDGYVSSFEFTLPNVSVVGKWMKLLFMWEPNLVKWELVSIVNSL